MVHWCDKVRVCCNECHCLRIGGSPLCSVNATVLGADEITNQLDVGPSSRAASVYHDSLELDRLNEFFFSLKTESLENLFLGSQNRQFRLIAERIS